MGFSHERGAAARTVLRARAIGDQDVIDDAETAVAGYLDHEDLDDYIARHYPNGLDQPGDQTAAESTEHEPTVTITAEQLATLREVAEAARDFYPVPWVRMGERNVSIVERSPRDGSITGGGPVAEAGHEVFAEHIVAFEPSIVLKLIAALEGRTHARTQSSGEPAETDRPDPMNDPVIAQHNHTVSQQARHRPPGF